MHNKFLIRRVDNVTSEAPESKTGSFVLEYYIIESELPESNDFGKVIVYGLEIVKKLTSELSEKNQIENVFCSREAAEGLVNILAVNSVTPVSLGYIIEDMLGV